VIAVVAVACTTPTGAFDPIAEIADVCQRYAVWLHVDAAHGGAVCFSKRHRHLVDGLELADSIVVDAHKMMFLPAVCAMVFFKDKKHRFTAFEQSAPYLFDPSAPDMAEFDNAVVTFECTKRAAALGLWGLWSMFGPELFEAMIDQTIDVALLFHQKLVADESFEAWIKPTCNIVVYRYLPIALREANPEQIDQLQLRLRRRLLEQGAAYLTQTRMDGRIYLRSTIMNPLTDSDALDRILQAMRESGRELEREMEAKGVTG
jgi:L-2,4-diaminobutyrate decarboxylase